MDVRETIASNFFETKTDKKQNFHGKDNLTPTRKQKSKEKKKNSPSSENPCSELTPP